MKKRKKSAFQKRYQKGLKLMKILYSVKRNHRKIQKTAESIRKRIK